MTAHSDAFERANSNPKHKSLTILVFAVLGLIAFGGSLAEAAVTACSATISTCGCRITKPGFYLVTADLDSTQGLTPGGNCLEVKADNVTVQVDSHSITGPGSAGLGIDVLHGAFNVVINGGSGFSDVEDWSVGVYIGGNQGVFSNISSNFNDLAGFEFDGANLNVLTDFDGDDNNTFGVWVRRGDSNTFTEGDFSSNGFTGLFIGCSSSKNGISGQNCKGVPNSSGNHAIDNTGDSNDSYGVAIDFGQTKQVITDTEGSSNTTDDLFDANASCGSNLWFDNSFDLANMGCID